VLRRRSSSSLSKSLGFLRSTCCDTRSVDGTGLLGMLLPPPMCAAAARTALASAQPYNTALSGSASAMPVMIGCQGRGQLGSTQGYLQHFHVEFMYQSYIFSLP